MLLRKLAAFGRRNLGGMLAALLVAACGGGGGGQADLSGPGTAAGSAPPAPAAPPAPQPGSDARRIDRGSFAEVSRDGSTIVYAGLTDNTAGLPANAGMFTNVFLYRIATRARTLVSVDPAGTAAGNLSSFPARLSNDGRYVVFASQATNLVPTIIYSAPPGGAPNRQIFARDLATGQTRLVSIDPSGFAAGNEEASEPFFVSGDGRYVAFASKATNLVAGVAYSPGTNVFVRDLVLGTTDLVSVAPDDVTAACCGWNNGSFPLAISDDGRYVAFISDSPNLVTGVTYAPALAGIGNIFLRDRVARSTRLLSLSPNGQEAANGSCGATAASASPMSRDGATVVFSCNATNLVIGPAYAADMQAIPYNNVFAWHQASPSLILVSRSPDGTASGNNGSFDAVVSADGRYVAFDSAATNLVPGVVYLTQGNSPGGLPSKNIFRWDRQTGTMQLITGRSNSQTGLITAADFDTVLPRISDNGQIVAFHSSATNIMATPPPGAVPGQMRNDAVFWNAATNVIALASIGGFGQPIEPVNTLPGITLSGTGNVITFTANSSAYFFLRQ